MKGIVFTEFLELVEDRFGLDVADHVLESAELDSGGVYTAVGSYPHHELVEMVGRLSARTGIEVPVLVRTFGEHLFGRFVALYPAFFDGIDDGIEFLCGVEDHIHVEVRKLYPDAELPRFDYERDGTTTSILYRSKRHFGDLAEGLIHACLRHFGTGCEVERTDLGTDGDESVVRFDLTPVTQRA